MTIRPITDDEIAAYRRDGVVKLAGLVSADQVAEIRRAVDHRMAHPGPYGYTKVYTQDRCFALGYPVLRAFVTDPVMGRNAARAMGSTTARFFFDHLFAFEPDTPVDGHYWHQDQPYWPVAGDHIVSFWVALTRCSADTSALKFVAGSHRSERVFPPLAFDGEPLPANLGPERRAVAAQAVDARDQFEPTRPPPYHDDPERYGVIEHGYDAGDAAMFHTRVVHSSGGNRSPDQERVAYSIRYLGDDARMMLRQGVFQDTALLPDPDEPFSVGAPMRSRRWPRVHP